VHRREGYAWSEDKEHCEEWGRILHADPTKVSSRAKKRGLPQMGTLGAGESVLVCSCGRSLKCEKWHADPTKVSSRAKKRGLPQMGTLGAGEAMLGNFCFVEFSEKRGGPWRIKTSTKQHAAHLLLLQALESACPLGGNWYSHGNISEGAL